MILCCAVFLRNHFKSKIDLEKDERELETELNPKMNQSKSKPRKPKPAGLDFRGIRRIICIDYK